MDIVKSLHNGSAALYHMWFVSKYYFSTNLNPLITSLQIMSIPEACVKIKFFTI